MPVQTEFGEAGSSNWKIERKEVLLEGGQKKDSSPRPTCPAFHHNEFYLRSRENEHSDTNLYKRDNHEPRRSKEELCDVKTTKSV